MHSKYFVKSIEKKLILSSILGANIKIKRVIHDARLEQLTKEMKYGILDFDIELESGELVNVEMQLNDLKNIEKRTTFYASKKIVEQLEPKEKYEELKRVIVIAILDYNLTSLSEYITETVRVVTTDRNYELNNVVKYYYIELEKFRNQNPNMKEEKNQWLAFIDMERGDLLEMAKKENKEIKKAIEDYEVLSGDEEVKRLAEIRLMSKLEENSALATARTKGTEEGLKLGREEGVKLGRKEGLKLGRDEGLKLGEKKKQIEIAKKMKEKNKSVEEIIEITGLTEGEIQSINV